MTQVTAEVTSEHLDDIFAQVDAIEQGSDDVVLDSCDEEDESDLDEPKALPPPTPDIAVAPAFHARASPFATASSSRPAPYRPVGQTPLRRPLASAQGNGVAASLGRGGRMVYSVDKRDSDAKYYMVQWRKPQTKKYGHLALAWNVSDRFTETWDGDAYLKLEGSRVIMFSEEGQNMGTTAIAGGGALGEGSELRIKGLDCEVDREVSADEFHRATSCLNNAANTPVRPSLAPPIRSALAPPGGTRTPVLGTGYAKPFKAPTIVRPFSAPTPSGPSTAWSTGSLVPKAVSADSFYAKAAPPKKIVIGEKNSKEREAWGGALHDPGAEGAVVFQRPPASEAKRRNTTINDVVLDPHLTSKLREHQIEGIKFMYSCVMGMTGANGQGCILADEMGLGKTLQTIALIYTLCKQSPWGNESSIIQRALIVVPVTLVKNWRAEFRKWLPRDFVTVAVEDSDESKITAFTHNRRQQVLIIGYERLRKVIKRLAQCVPPIGLIVCDEGHRLKGKDTKTTKMFDVLKTSRRIILTGTPLQNDLSEYWAMADFACPGVFGSYSAFCKQYERPILKARLANCPSKDVAIGQQRSDEMIELAKEFVLRRTAEVLENYLPPKSEYVVFVSPTTTQLEVLTRILGCGAAALMNRLRGQSFAMINYLKKAANSPSLLRKKDDDSTGNDDLLAIIQSAIALLGPDNRSFNFKESGKLIVLERILQKVYDARTEKIVVVSNYTSTLNIIQDMCVKRRYSFLRLDGSTPQKQRQDLVERFNRTDRLDSMVFLLSAKAGGVGINLIGASRLVLFDSDWNPSTDLQAMARIHRDGQKKPVFIYRLLTTNTIDEKIYQRQVTKTGLSDQMMGGASTGNGKDAKDSFSNEELRDIFTLDVQTNSCQTHDLLACTCGGKNTVKDKSETPSEASPVSSDEEHEAVFVSATQFDPEPTPKMVRKTERAQQAKLAALQEWYHIDAFESASFKKVNDELLYSLVKHDFKTHNTVAEPDPIEDADEDEPPAKKRKNGGKRKVTRGRTSDDSEDEGGESDGEKEEDDDDYDGGAADSGSDDSQPVRLPQRRKRTPRGTKNGKTVKLGEKRHNLRTLADSDQGGRIMFLFEKNSKSRL